MNKQRRKMVSEIIENLDDFTSEIKDCLIAQEITDARCQLDKVIREEEEAFDNLPEGIQESDKGEEMEEFIEAMRDLAQEIDKNWVLINDHVDSLIEAKEELEDLV